MVSLMTVNMISVTITLRLIVLVMGRRQWSHLFVSLQQRLSLGLFDHGLSLQSPLLRLETSDLSGNLIGSQVGVRDVLTIAITNWVVNVLMLKVVFSQLLVLVDLILMMNALMHLRSLWLLDNDGFGSVLGPLLLTQRDDDKGTVNEIKVLANHAFFKVLEFPITVAGGSFAGPRDSRKDCQDSSDSAGIHHGGGAGECIVCWRGRGTRLIYRRFQFLKRCKRWTNGYGRFAAVI